MTPSNNITKLDNDAKAQEGYIEFLSTFLKQARVEDKEKDFFLAIFPLWFSRWPINRFLHYDEDFMHHAVETKKKVHSVHSHNLPNLLTILLSIFGLQLGWPCFLLQSHWMGSIGHRF